MSCRASVASSSRTGILGPWPAAASQTGLLGEMDGMQRCKCHECSAEGREREGRERVRLGAVLVLAALEGQWTQLYMLPAPVHGAAFAVCAGVQAVCFP